jgi:SAM-dependent methyltransferase
MLRKVLPHRVRTHLREEFRRLLLADLPGTLVRTCSPSVNGMVEQAIRKVVEQTLRADLPDRVRQTFREQVGELLPAKDGFFPHTPPGPYAVQRLCPEAGPVDEAFGLPVPPQALWAGYGSTAEVYLRSGQLDVQNMSEVYRRAGGEVRQAGRILEFGCSAGRMLRWLHPLTKADGGPACEVWGVDITADHIHWCQEHLCPPFHFATTTLHPHLPFEDRYLGFVFAGSVFTHLGDLADAWFQELRRVLRPGGRLYVTLHDKHTVELLRRETWHWLSGHLAGLPGWDEVSRSDFGVLTVSGDEWTSRFTFHDIDFLCRRLQPFFAVLSVTPEAYGYQTALLLERR